MKKLTESEILQLMREEWDRKLQALSETVDAIFTAKVDGEEKNVLSKGLKLRNKVKGKEEKKGYLYTVTSVSPREVYLMAPDGIEFMVDKETLEKEYELD